MAGVNDPRVAEAPSLSPETWARRLRRGEPRAVEEVRHRVARILAHGGLAIPDQERDDLEQEVMAEIWQAVNRSRFDFSAGFWGFVEVVTSRRCIDWLRTRREKLPLPEEVVSPHRGPLRQTLERERSDLGSEVLSALDPPCRELITLRLRDDLSYAEIARATGKTEGALRIQLYRCIRRAREVLQRFGDEGRSERRGGSRP